MKLLLLIDSSLVRTREKEKKKILIIAHANQIKVEVVFMMEKVN